MSDNEWILLEKIVEIVRQIPRSLKESLYKVLMGKVEFRFSDFSNHEIKSAGRVTRLSNPNEMFFKFLSKREAAVVCNISCFSSASSWLSQLTSIYVVIQNLQLSIHPADSNEYHPSLQANRG
jgi:hypothetical protein